MELIYNVVLISNVQQNDPVLYYTCIYIYSFPDSSRYRLSQLTEYVSLHSVAAFAIYLFCV